MSLKSIEEKEQQRSDDWFFAFELWQRFFVQLFWQAKCNRQCKSSSSLVLSVPFFTSFCCPHVQHTHTIPLVKLLYFACHLVCRKNQGTCYVELTLNPIDIFRLRTPMVYWISFGSLQWFFFLGLQVLCMRSKKLWMALQSNER